MLKLLLDLLAPVKCVVCASPKVLFCRVHLPNPQSLSFHHEGLPGRYAYELDQSMLALLSSFKDRSMTAIAPLLGELLDPIVKDPLWEASDIIAIPPTTPKAYRKRGFVPVLLMLRKSKQSKRLVSLGLVKKIQDQRSLGAQERIANLSGAFRTGGLAGKRVLLFDDVMTTGATLSEMRRAVEQAGGLVIGFCVLARRMPENVSGPLD